MSTASTRAAKLDTYPTNPGASVLSSPCRWPGGHAHQPVRFPHPPPLAPPGAIRQPPATGNESGRRWGSGTTTTPRSPRPIDRQRQRLRLQGSLSRSPAGRPGRTRTRHGARNDSASIPITPDVEPVVDSLPPDLECLVVNAGAHGLRASAGRTPIPSSRPARLAERWHLPDTRSAPGPPSPVPTLANRRTGPDGSTVRWTGPHTVSSTIVEPAHCLHRPRRHARIPPGVGCASAGRCSTRSHTDEPVGVGKAKPVLARTPWGATTNSCPPKQHSWRPVGLALEAAASLRQAGRAGRWGTRPAGEVERIHPRRHLGQVRPGVTPGSSTIWNNS